VLSTRWNAVCYSVLPCVAVCCSVLECIAQCCSVLQSVLQRVAVCCSDMYHWIPRQNAIESALSTRWSATCCNVLQCAVVCCSVMQCDAVWCSDRYQWDLSQNALESASSTPRNPALRLGSHLRNRIPEPTLLSHPHVYTHTHTETHTPALSNSWTPSSWIRSWAFNATRFLFRVSAL